MSSRSVPNRIRRHLPAWTLLILFLTALQAVPVQAAASSFGGIYTGWPAAWEALQALNDADDGFANERVELVGDDDDPGAFYVIATDYLFFRVRVDDGAATEFSDTIMILIDYDPLTDGPDGDPDFGFAWDSQSNNQTAHGLEMVVLNVLGSTWAGTRMTDLDGNNGAKVSPPDVTLDSLDGYVRIVNGQATTAFGTTTFVDFAVNWSYLEANTPLRQHQTWGLQVGTIAGANDHNFIDDDVAGKKNVDDALTFPATFSTSPTAIADIAAHAAGERRSRRGPQLPQAHCSSPPSGAFKAHAGPCPDREFPITSIAG